MRIRHPYFAVVYGDAKFSSPSEVSRHEQVIMADQTVVDPLKTLTDLVTTMSGKSKNLETFVADLQAAQVTLFENQNLFLLMWNL